MDTAADSLTARRSRLRVAAGVAVLLAVFVLSLQVSQEMRDRRAAGFCRRDIVNGDPKEELVFVPFGERCSVKFPDGKVLVREPGWELSALIVLVGGVMVAGAVAGSGTVRRRVALAVVIPTTATAGLLLAVAPIRSIPRLAGLVTVAVALGLIPGLLTAVGVWVVARGNPRTTALLSITAWALVVVLAGQDGLADG